MTTCIRWKCIVVAAIRKHNYKKGILKFSRVTDRDAPPGCPRCPYFSPITTFLHISPLETYHGYPWYPVTYSTPLNHHLRSARIWAVENLNGGFYMFRNMSRFSRVLSHLCPMQASGGAQHGFLFSDRWFGALAIKVDGNNIVDVNNQLPRTRKPLAIEQYGRL